MCYEVLVHLRSYTICGYVVMYHLSIGCMWYECMYMYVLPVYGISVYVWCIWYMYT